MNEKTFTMTEMETSPVVELDSAAQAAYVRFSDRPVAETKLVSEGDCIVTADYDTDGRLIGVELIGVKEFGIGPLMKAAGFPPLRKELSDQTRYISAPRRELTTA